MEEGVFFVFLFKKRGGGFYHIDSSEVCLKHLDILQAERYRPNAVTVVAS